MLTIKISGKSELTQATEDNFEPNYEEPWCVLEHNVDIWFLFNLLATLKYSKGNGDYASKRNQLGKAIIDRMWLAQESRVTQGV